MNRRFYSILMLFSMCAFGSARGQESSAFADTRLYDAVLERLFQHDVQQGPLEVQLRYTYCNLGENQIVIHKLGNSDFRLDVWYVAAGIPNIWNQLAHFVRSNPTLNADNAIGLIKMNHKTIVVHNTVLTTLIEKASSLSIPLLNPSTVTLDGMAYGLAVRSIAEDVNVTLQGPQQSDTSANQLIRWMGQIRSSTEPELKDTRSERPIEQ